MYSKKQFRNLFKANKKDAIRLRAAIEKRYEQSYQDMSLDEFLDWYFENYCFDQERYLKYVKVPEKLKRKKQLGDLIKSKGAYYVKVSVWKDEESKIQLTTFKIGDLMKHFAGKFELEETLATYIKDDEVFSLLGLKYSYSKTEISKEQNFPTNDNWYGTYIIDNKKIVKGTMMHLVSNLDLWTIHLGGNDDYSISKAFTSKEDAMNEWDRLSKLKSVSNEMEGYYFSN